MRRPPRDRRCLVGLLVTLAGLAAIAALCSTRANELVDALAVSWWILGLLVAAHVATLILRSEAWRVSLAAVDQRAPCRRAVHAANAAAFAAGSVQSHASLPVRVTLLRRLDPAGAPRPGQIAVADVPIVLLEVCGACALIAVAGLVALLDGGPDPVEVWTAPAALALAAALLLLGRRVLRRAAHRPLARGLAILGDRGLRGGLARLVAVICALGALRVWVALVAVGLPHGVGEVALVFAALGVLGLLPLGPSATPAATFTTLGASDLGAALAAGIALSASSIAAVLVYAVGVEVARRVTPRDARGPRRRRRGGTDPPWGRERCVPVKTRATCARGETPLTVTRRGRTPR